MRKNPETFQELADTLCSTACYSTAARRLGVSPASVFRWLADSKRAETDKSDDFRFLWGGEMDYLHRHCGRAVRIQVAAVEGYARHRALHGHDEGIFYQGKPSWRVREDIARNGDLDAEPDILELLYGQRDVYERDARGNRIQETIHHAPSDGLVSMVLKAHLPKLYGTRIEQSVTHAGGVHVVHSAPRPAPVAQQPEPARIEPPQERVEVEHVEHEMVSTEDLDPRDLAAGHHEDDDEPDDIPLTPAPAPRPVERVIQDRSMIDSATGIRERVGSDFVFPGGARVL
jgi:hypothetical protein